MRNISLTRVSRGMAAVLRHGIGGAKIDEHGWVALDELAQTLTKLLRAKIEEKHILDVIRSDDIGRYEFDENKLRIRALYGHSIPVTINYRKVNPEEVETLYHGTVMERMEKIRREGLKPLNRLWVHMYSSFKLAAARSLRRRGTPVILAIDAKRLASECMLFKAGKYVYVTKHVPSKFIKGATKPDAPLCMNSRM